MALRRGFASQRDRPRPLRGSARRRAVGLWGILWVVVTACLRVFAAELPLNDASPLTPPAVGSYGLRALSPDILELTLVATKEPDPARVESWDFVAEGLQPRWPATNEFTVLVAGARVPVQKVGFKRRVLYAPLGERDLRIGNSLYLELSRPIGVGQAVEVKSPGGALGGTSMVFQAVASATRWNPALHVNQVGYLPSFSKKAMVGYYLGSLGELNVPAQSGFRVVESATGREVYRGNLVPRPDQGYVYTPTPYQKVFEADFTAFNTPGEYRLQVAGMGVSWPFTIDAAVAGAFARTFALGLYHQRCGTANELPFTRHVHDACHAAAAEIPTLQFTNTQRFLAAVSADSSKLPRHTAPQLKSTAASLYPFVLQGKVDVAGGHHDAGDYSKYTINSAALIHFLVFAVDAFPGVGTLDNLGLPESGDGLSDVLQEAKWEADFLAKMQDADGGFYFLVYPRDRKYEDDVLPDRGDSQVVWPKTTAVTAAAVAALAEAASSPLFKRQFPAAAATYLRKAQLGWSFLQKAIAKYGKDGSYQKITHYGNEFLHDDELAWAAAALFGATGEATYQAQLKSWFDPTSVGTRRWGWWRLFEAYGCAARSYAFAARSGRLATNQLDSVYLAKCESELLALGEDRLRDAAQNAYGSSFPEDFKKNRDAGWYFSTAWAFDLAVAHQIQPRTAYLDAILGNVNYEMGGNPVNVTYVTGLGSRRQREIVHQFAQNDARVLPPSGIPQGNIQSGFAYLDRYKSELGGLTFPGDGIAAAPYPFYDRWGDSFNTTTEFTVVELSRSLATSAFLIAQTPLRTQTWRPVAAQIAGVPARGVAEEPVTARLVLPQVDWAKAMIVWEARDQPPNLGSNFTFAPVQPGRQWVEAEIQLPDGRRYFAATNFTAALALTVPPNAYQSTSLLTNAGTVALFHLDEDVADATGRRGALALAGNAALDWTNVGWMARRNGQALRVLDIGDRATLSLPSRQIFGAAGTEAIRLSAMLYVNQWKAYNRASQKLMSLFENSNASIELMEDLYAGPQIRGGVNLRVSADALANLLTLKQWHHLGITITRAGYIVELDGRVFVTQASTELTNWGRRDAATLELGNFDGWIDEVILERLEAAIPLPALVALPVVTPNGGFFPNPVVVTMTTATAGAEIRYTLDGKLPTPSSALYMKPLTVGGPLTVSARAYKEGMAESALARAVFQVNSPDSCEAVGRLPAGEFQVRVLGYSGQRFTLEASTNLLSWLPIAPVTLRESEYLFIDLAARVLPGRFYRAVPTP